MLKHGPPAVGPRPATTTAGSSPRVRGRARRAGALADFAALRRTEFARLDRLGEAYLDWTGAALYGESQLRAHEALLHGSVLGNPHSESGPSRASTRVVEAARARVLAFFRAHPREWVVCFTANASTAIRLVAESYPFAAGSQLVLAADNHNSVNGIREHALARGAEVRYLPLDGELRLLRPEAHLLSARPAPSGASGASDAAPAPRSLLAFPAQSNFSGVRHPLELATRARQMGYDVLLDAAAFAPTNELRLDAVDADFVALSFYKMFGYPTGIGALLARRDALARLRRPWFAGAPWSTSRRRTARTSCAPAPRRSRTGRRTSSRSPRSTPASRSSSVWG